MGKLVEIANLSFSYNGKLLFDKLDLEFTEGNFYTLVGPTGSGKTTLLRILVGLEPTHDYIKVDGDFLNPKNMEKIRSKVRFVSESSRTEFVTNQVSQELEFELKRRNANHILETILEFAKKYEIEDLLPRKISELSRGEQQIVAFLTAIITSPKLLLLDNAFTEVETSRKNHLLEIYKKEQKGEVTIVETASSLSEAPMSKEILLLDNGKILFQDKMKNLVAHEKELEKHHIELPFSLDLSLKLRYYDRIQEVEMDSRKLVDYLWK